MNEPLQKHSRRLTAVGVRYLLSALLILMLLGMGGLFYLAYGKLRANAADVATIQSKADSADQRLQTLLRLNTTLQQNKDIVNRAKDIVSDSQHYQYQNQIITDLSSYARQTGVGITGFNFSEGAGGAKPGAAASNSGSPATPPAGSPAPTAPKSVRVSLQLADKISYRSFLNFINRIEQNLSRMQITDIALTRNAESPNFVQPQAMTLEVYVR